MKKTIVQALLDIAAAISGGGSEGNDKILIIHDVDGTLDKTYQDISSAMEDGFSLLRHV